MIKQRAMLFALVLAVVTVSPQLLACTVQLSDHGVLRMNSGDSKTIQWNPVPGATSYFVQDFVQGLGDPASPDFTFGGAYTESHNGEAPGLTSYPIGHSVLYKMTFRLIVTALNRSDPNWVPCSADVVYVVDADTELASVASRRIVPIAGAAPGFNGAAYTTSLVLTGTGIGDGAANATEKFYQGRIYFRPLGSRASDSDPSIPYALNGQETLVFADVMQQLGATGIGSLEVIPRVGFPTPQADALIENVLPDGKRVGSRVPAVLGRDELQTSQKVAVPIVNGNDTRVSLGIRAFGDLGGFLILQHQSADGTIIETVNRSAQGDTTALFPLGSLFSAPLVAGDRVTASFAVFDPTNLPNASSFTGGKAAVLFLTETGNDLNNPNVVYREPLSPSSSRYSNGFDPFLVR